MSRKLSNLYPLPRISEHCLFKQQQNPHPTLGLTLVKSEVEGPGVTRMSRKKMVPSFTSSLTSSPKAVAVASNFI
jgi:hypothetical protein